VPAKAYAADGEEGRLGEKLPMSASTCWLLMAYRYRSVSDRLLVAGTMSSIRFELGRNQHATYCIHNRCRQHNPREVDVEEKDG
jgi:hypothetical protein